ncbi:MAG TPA: calcium-binding protein, partial [Moraxellaceae bacterium]|nr:calcium-binding protein [Moraxellaceae bacterium]
MGPEHSQMIKGIIMANLSIEGIYDFSLQQLVAESYLEEIESLRDSDYLRKYLRLGTNRDGYNFKDNPSLGDPDLNEGWPGYTRMTLPHIDEFLSRFTIIHQWSDNPSTGAVSGVRPAPDMEHQAGLILNGPDMLANTGLSATLIQKNGTNEYTLSIRSTESRPWEQGGDKERDLVATDAQGVVMTGFALAQLDALEKYYQWLKDNALLPSGAVLNVTGYSLGGHLATVFTEIHQNDDYLGAFGNTVTFNGAGRGTWNGSIGNEAEFLAWFRQALKDPASVSIDFSAYAESSLAKGFAWMAASGFLPSGSEWLDTATGASVFDGLRTSAIALAESAFDAKSLYADARYGWAAVATMIRFGLAPQLPLAEHTTMADHLISQVYGYEAIRNVNMTANSQNNGVELPVAVESQPLVDGAGGLFGNGDYGYAHSIDLITDSLVLQRALHQLDPTFNVDTLLDVMPRMSAITTRSVVGTTYEADALENALDGIRRAVLGPDVTATPFRQGAGGFGDWASRNSYHENVRMLTEATAFEAIAGKVSIGLSGTEAAVTARKDFGALVGLLTLSPLRITATAGNEELVETQLAQAWPDVFARWSEDKEAAQASHFTDAWLSDRAAMMAGLLQVNLENAQDCTIHDPQVAEGRRFQDLQFNLEVNVLADDSSRIAGKVLFDRDWTTTPVSGSEGNDHLYAGVGGSDLDGEGGNDYLEGQAGNDVLRGGAGRDILLGLQGGDILLGGTGEDRLEGG